MRRKVLFTANTLRHLYLCHIPYLKYFKENGYEVHIASDSDVILEGVDKSFKLPIKRTPYNFKNIKAIFELKKILQIEKYDIIHTHTPMGSVVTRLAVRLAKLSNTKVIYTVHGFHFFKGCSLKKYILYYPIEKLLSRYTDLMITINKEDYEFAKKHFNTEISYVPGVGFNEEKFSCELDPEEKKKFRESLGLKESDYIICYVAEISKRKRQDYLIKTISMMDITNERFLFVGDMTKNKKIKKLINKYKLDNIVKMIDFNDDVCKYLDISDLVISVSMQEGLPLNIMEAMYKEKAIIVTDCRGNRDLIKNKINGLVVSLNGKKELINAIEYLKKNEKISMKFKIKSREMANKYSVNSIMKEMKKIYKKLMR